MELGLCIFMTCTEAFCVFLLARKRKLPGLLQQDYLADCRVTMFWRGFMLFLPLNLMLAAFLLGFYNFGRCRVALRGRLGLPRLFQNLLRTDRLVVGGVGK